MASAPDQQAPLSENSTACTNHAHTQHRCTPLPQDCQHTRVHAHSSRLQIDQDVAKFDCSICLDVCRDPVVTMCGHLFCWPCLYYWLSLQSAVSKKCPVCKGDVQDKIIPLYGCGKAGYLTSSLANGIHMPCRPSATSSTASSTSAITSQEYNPNHDIQYHAGHRISATPSPHLGLLTALVRFGFACLHPQNGGFFSRRAASNLVRQRRFKNEKEFVLHWGFIFTALVAIGFFLLC